MRRAGPPELALGMLCHRPGGMPSGLVSVLAGAGPTTGAAAVGQHRLRGCRPRPGAGWTNEVGRAHRVAGAVRAGPFWVNGYKTINVASPFGGFGRSGFGRSSGREALAACTQTKSVWVETAAQPGVAFGYVG